MGRQKSSKPARLAQGRPPTARRATASLSARATRTLIRSHHQLQKALDTARKGGDDAQAADLERQIESLGGLKSYQQASIQGQSHERGGDSSRVLLEWVTRPNATNASVGRRLRLLEVGALSTSNACSRADIFDVTRIDLNSQSEGILQQDFMQRPLPTSDADRFDVISLSLVLNFVPDAAARGRMVSRTCQFLRTQQSGNPGMHQQSMMPALFLVLPAPCVSNSRYLDEARLGQIMSSLGYMQLQRKLSSKLIYYLWHHSFTPNLPVQQFAKTEVNPGRQRNNFSITLHEPDTR